MSLNDYSTKDLEKELEARKKREKNIPQMIDNPDFTEVKNQAQEIIDSVKNGTYHEDNDNEVYMLEAVMKACFGKNVYKYINKNTN